VGQLGFHPGMVRAMPSNGGCRMCGLASFFLGGVWPSEELVVGAFGGG
jgi:hypothetical protein